MIDPLDPDERDAIVLSAFRITMSVLVNLEESERAHIMMWLRAMMKNRTKGARPRTREQRVRFGEKISYLYGKPRGFARKLRIILWERGISMAEFAKMMEMLPWNVSYWMSMEWQRGPQKKTVAKAAHVLGVDEEELLPERR